MRKTTDKSTNKLHSSFIYTHPFIYYRLFFLNYAVEFYEISATWQYFSPHLQDRRAEWIRCKITWTL